MEPKAPSPEAAPNQPSPSPEYQPSVEQSNEQQEYSPERSVERAGETPQVTPPATSSPPVITLPTPVPVQSADDVVAPSDDDTPLNAGDDDLIEKEWVDKAKKIITETKDDPHQREQEVGKLQADYLRKRYGKELGESS